MTECVERVWLILPMGDNDDWEPASVFETSEQAVEALQTEEDFELEVKHIGPNRVMVSAPDKDGYTVQIIAVPIEYLDAPPTTAGEP
jgi:hypothetical protein